MKPLAVVATHPIQYQAPLYRYLAAHDFPLRVLFLDDSGLHPRHDPGFDQEVAWDIPLTDGYEHRFLINRSPLHVDSFLGLVNPALVREISAKRYSAVLIHGWRSLSMLLALGTARMRGLPVLYRSETPAPADARAHLAGALLRRLASGCLAIGTLNAHFYRELGFREDALFTAPYAVDNDRFQRAFETTSCADARRRLGLPPSGLIVLFSGKLVPWKQPDLLLRAFNRLEDVDAHLVFVGDGRMRVQLEQEAVLAGRGRVHFLGFLNQARIPLAYRASDLLVLPSVREPWGLAVNEAMNFCLPAIVSDQVGCGADLIRPGLTGEVFPHDSEQALLSHLHRLLTAPDLLRKQGRAAQKLITTWGFAQCEEAFRCALEKVGAVT